MFTCTSVVTPSTSVRSRIERIRSVAVVSVVASQARTSTSISQRSGTTLGRAPPESTPTFTVTPFIVPFIACSSTVFVAASRTA